MKKLKQMYRRRMEEKKYGNGKTTGCPTKTFGHDRRAGFTLVELVITIAIVIILSVISVPIYRGYIDKAKMSECYAAFASIITAQKAYYSEHGNFLAIANSACIGGSFTNNEPVLGIDLRGNKYSKRFRIAGDYPQVKHYFAAEMYKPADVGNPDKGFLFLQYNTTKGSRIVEWDEVWSAGEIEYL